MSDQPERETRRMSVIPKEAAEGRTVLQPEGDGIVAFRGENGPVQFVCGGCRAVLIEEVQPDQVTNTVVRCNACGCFNETVD